VRFFSIVALILANIVIFAQTQKPATSSVIQGVVQSENIPIPGAGVTATNTDTGEKVSTSTDPNGQYHIQLPAAGSYVVETSMAAFAPASKETTIEDPATPLRLDFNLTLASRSQQKGAQPRPALGFRGRGSQRLQLQQTAAEPSTEPQSGETAPPAQPHAAAENLPADAPSESVSVLGNTAATTFGNNFNFDREQIQRFIDSQFGLQPAQPGQAGPEGAAGVAGQRGPAAFVNRGAGFAPGGAGFIGGRGGFGLGRGGRGFGATAPRGNLSYALSDSAFDAAPYAICATPPCTVAKPQFMQNQFTATLGGPFVIPHIVKNTNSNYTVSYNGSRSENPAEFFSTVPTLAERAGDFSQSTIHNGANAGNFVQIFHPVTHVPFNNNVIPPGMQNSAALGLLKFIPAPNLPGSLQNFQYVTAATTNSNALNLRFNHTFAPPQQAQGGRNGGGRGGFGGFGPRGGGRGGRRGSNMNFALNVLSSDSVVSNPFPAVGGSNTRSGIQATFGYIRPLGSTNTTFNIQYNRNRTTATNLYAFQQNIAGLLGIAGVSQNPFDWGLPNLSFTNFTGLNDTRAAMRRDQTLQFSEGTFYSHSRHNLRWGGDFRLTQSEIHSTQNSRGSFTFSGARTAAVDQSGSPIQGTGYDFADFLLGLPQQTTLQYGSLTYNFSGNSWDAFIQDDWRLRGNLTLQYGVRYDYASPYVERNNQLVNLDFAPGFTAVVPVQPGQAGPFHGVFPRSLVKPDRNNFSPRLGLAWRVTNKTVLRAGYGVNYNGSAYSTIAAQLANQPPFSTTATNIYSPSLPLSLQNGFPPVNTAAVTNTYGIDPNYRVGYAQIWNLDIQRELGKGLVLNVDYTGTKGTRLDIIEAPNRTSTGLRLSDVQPFNWEASEGNSILHSAAIRLNRRLGRGLSFGGTYQFSKSIDDASSVSGAGGQGVVAQNAFDLSAERGPSSFDIRHRVGINYNFELPFGTNKAFLAKESIYKTLFGDWLLNGGWTINSGSPLTVHVLGSYTDVNRGSNGSLRADATGLPVALDHPSIAEWFNTAAFAVPAPGQFGNVGRNTVRGPGQIIGNLNLNKTFMFSDGRSIDVRAQSTNFLNTPQFRGVDTNVNSPTFGKVTSAGQMRTIQFFIRYNF
jgi:hypothetical protein